MVKRDWGLSPLARGNQRMTRIEYLIYGPIPTRAGEPLPLTHKCHLPTAYPHSRGGTSHT